MPWAWAFIAKAVYNLPTAKLLVDALRMAGMSERNLEKAKQYGDQVLRERRRAFYRYVWERTKEWIAQRR